MAEFQTVLGIVLIVMTVVIIAIAAWNLWIIGKATTDMTDIKATITDAEKKGVIAANVILIILALVLGVYGVVVLLPTEKATAGISSLRGSRSLAGTVLSPTGQYM